MSLVKSNPRTKSEKIVAAFFNELLDRSGIDHALESIDSEIQEEIVEELEKKVEAILVEE